MAPPAKAQKQTNVTEKIQESEDKPEDRFKPLNDRRFSHNELAEILGVVPGTVRGQATRCRDENRLYHKKYYPEGDKWFEVDPTEAKIAPH